MRIPPQIAVAACIAALSGCSVLDAPADPLRQIPIDHYDPVALNELAAARVRQGDTTTAWILLERAARLAPYDRRIARNLAVLRAFRAGVPAPAIAEPPPLREPLSSRLPDGRASENPLFAEPPTLWKAK